MEKRARDVFLRFRSEGPPIYYIINTTIATNISTKKNADKNPFEQDSSKCVWQSFLSSQDNWNESTMTLDDLGWFQSGNFMSIWELWKHHSRINVNWTTLSQVEMGYRSVPTKPLVTGEF